MTDTPTTARLCRHECGRTAARNRTECNTCRAARWRADNPGGYKTITKRYREKLADRTKGDHLCNEGCGRTAEPSRLKCRECWDASRLERGLEDVNSDRRNKWQELKRKTADAYGGRCSCCGVTELIFLNIDHVEPIGGHNRGGLSGWNLMKDALARVGDGYYQLLCFNCNFAKHWGGCPHQS